MDALKEGLVLLVQELMEAEVKEKTGAEGYERTPARRTHRNGYRPRRWDTRVGSVKLWIPKVRQGSYFPTFTCGSRALVVKVREGGRVVNMAAVAVRVTATGEREVLGFDVGPAESYGFWVSFLRGLAARGLRGVKS